MYDKALGLIETKGLIGAIEATDAAAKAAGVVISSVELTDAALVTIKIEGDLGAVQAAVKAGSDAAEKIGELIAAHVIPNPDNELGSLFPPRRYISKYYPNDDRPPLSPDSLDKPKPRSPRPTPSAPTKQKPAKQVGQDLENKTVSELRQIARSLKDISLKGREISVANKTQLIDAIKKCLRME